MVVTCERIGCTDAGRLMARAPPRDATRTGAHVGTLAS